jgi:hypothetical protein
MKKAVQLLLVVAMIATSASAVFADAKINAWGRGIFAPAVSGAETTPSNGVSWGKHARIGWTINAQDKDGNIGFRVDMNCDAGNADTGDKGDGHERIGLQDEQKIWAKPIPIVTVEIGRSVFYQTLRGDSAFGSWNYMRFNGLDEEDNIFARGKAGQGDAAGLRQTGAQNGVYGGTIIHLDTQGIHVFASLDQSDDTVLQEASLATSDPITGAVTPGDPAITEVTEVYTTSLMFQRGQYGAGYEIPNVGLVRAQYIGKAYLDPADGIADEELTNYGVFNAAVRLDKLVPNVYVDLGTFIPLKSKDDCGEVKKVNLYAKYVMGNMTFHFTAQTKLNADDPESDDDKLAFHIGAGADIGIGNGLTLNADVRYFDKVWMGIPDGGDGTKASVGFLAGVAKGFSNGKIAAGFEMITGYGTIAAANNSKEELDDNQWAIPIVIEYSFW